MTGKPRTEPVSTPVDEPADPAVPVQTPVEDTPEPLPSPLPAPAEPERFAHADEVPYLDGHEPDTIAAFRRQQLAAYERGEVGVGALIARPPMLADLRDDHPLSAAEALAEVFRRVEPIAKGHKAEPSAGGYSFRGIDDVYSALHDLFAEVGLVMLPSTIAREREQRPRASGNGVNYVTHVHVRLRFLAADGSSEELDGWGEGADTGDKSTGKAYSQAIKSALLAAFLIPTEQSAQDDPDRTNSEASRSFSPEEVKRAQTALDAARQQTTLDSLVATGRRAVNLLDVPLTGPDGTVAPLRLHLDALRLALESRVPEATS